MKKKCGFIALVGMLSIFLASCLSTGFGNTLLTKENAGTLASKNFKLNYIYLVSDFSLTDKDVAVKIIENLPFEKVASDLSDNYELTLDTSLFSKDALSSEVTQPVSDKGAALRGWVWKNESEEAGAAAGMTVVLNAYNSSTPVFISVKTTLTDSNGTVLDHVYGQGNWSSATTIADKENAAVINFGKHISPDFIYTDKGIETFSTYSENNKCAEGGVYVDTTYPVKISTTVSDPGVFMVVDPMTFFGAVIEDTYESGKTYTISYKIDRSTFSKYDWKVNFSKEEK